MPINPDDYYMRGETPIYRRPAAAAAPGSVLTTRLQVVAGSQPISGISFDYIHWDVDPDWDDFGHDPTEWVNGNFFFTGSWEVEIEVFAQLEFEACGVPGGTALIAILAGGSGDPANFVDEHETTEISPIVNTQLHLSATHRFYGTDSELQTAVHLFSAPNATIVQASITLKHTAIPPLP